MNPWVERVAVFSTVIKNVKAFQVTHILALGVIRVEFQSSGPGANSPALAGDRLVAAAVSFSKS